MIYYNIRNLTTYNIVSDVCRVPETGLVVAITRWDIGQESEVGVRVHTTQPRYHSILLLLH